MYLSGSQNIQKSMNGLLRIRATEIEADDAFITNINDLQTINGKIGENLVIDVDTGKVIEFKDAVQMDSSLNISGTLDVSGNTTLKNSLNVLGTLDVSGNTTLKNSLNVLGTLDVSGNTTLKNSLDLTGSLTIRDTTNPNTYSMSVYYDPTSAGWRFLNNQVNGYMYFSVKNPANPSQFKNFQFQASQVYTNIPLYVDNTHTISYNNNLVLGDSNTSVWYGSAIKYVPNTSESAGLCFYNKAFNNAPSVYYTNFTHNNMSNVETPTFRMNYANIWSMVKHTFISDASMNANLRVNGVTTLNGNLVANANIHASSFDCSNNAIFNGASTFNNSFNAQSGTFASSLQVNGNTLTNSLSVSNNATITGNITISGNSINNISGQNTFTGTITANNIITQNGTTASTNTITQNRIVNDVTGNPNRLKYTEFLYNNSGNTTPEAVISCKEEGSGYSMLFFPKLGSGSYNPIVKTDDRGIFSFFPKNNNAITITNWADTRVGIRVATTSINSPSVDCWAKNCNLNIDGSFNYITMSGNNSTSSNPDVRILNTSNARGFNFIANSALNTMNTFVGANEAVIGTQTQNNSSIVITTNNSAIDHGIRVLSNSSTSATITSRVSTNSIITNQTNHTINGPIFFSSPATFQDPGVNFQFGLAVGAGDISMNRFDSSFNNITSNDKIVIKSLENNHYSDNHYFRKNDGTDGCNVIVKGSIFLQTAGTALQFPSGQNQLDAWNSTNAGYSKSGSNLVLNSGISLQFPDASVQSTAYTTANNTKLQAIGTIVTATLTTGTLTTATIRNCGSMVLAAGTWIITLNSCFTVITGSTTIAQLLTSHSTSSTALSTNSGLSIINLNNATFGVGLQWVLTTTSIVTPATSTTYYCLVNAGFGTASRLQFNAGNSNFSAIRIA